MNLTDIEKLYSEYLSKDGSPDNTGEFVRWVGPQVRMPQPLAPTDPPYEVLSFLNAAVLDAWEAFRQEDSLDPSGLPERFLDYMMRTYH